MTTQQQVDDEIHEDQLLNFLVNTLTGEFSLTLGENAEIDSDDIFEVLSARSDQRKVWILTASTDFMIGHRRFDVIEHLPEAELDTAINEAQMADEARLVRRLCFVKNLYAGDVLEEAARRVGVSQANSSRWAHAWNGRCRWTPTEFRRPASETPQRAVH